MKGTSNGALRIFMESAKPPAVGTGGLHGCCWEFAMLLCRADFEKLIRETESLGSVTCRNTSVISNQ